MMKTLDICNRALSKLGQRHITALGKSQDPISMQCSLLYHPARKETLSACRWSFAVKADTIIALPEVKGVDVLPPPFKRQFPLPTRCLRVLDVPLSRWSLMGRRLVAPGDIDALVITYIDDVEDTTRFDPLFVDALVCRLAEKLALPVTGSHSLRQNLLNEYHKILLPQASHINQVQHNSNDQHPLQGILKRSLFS